jgi:cell division protein FtsL
MENPLLQLLGWFCNLQRLVAVFLCTLVILSAFGVVRASHETRVMYRELQVLQKTQDDLESEYEKLLLEQSAWSNNTRVDQIARGDLQMIAPDVAKIVVMRK